ncbi:hypothetical protein GGC64_002064 [Mycobacterium sp. OAS707]|uniref:hypothetical protein n=1 Tax=Mycobacterium sp. OAS707 TaxID=2663822 RepID=UPI00178B2653|nr:hypothetical protein [Mycobacterium sp. OAS707]MBE1548056.1 hypothetical protein [Mycobacterium sp. OAS707]
MTSTNTTRKRWIAATAKIVIASGAIAAGAMALSPAAQADAQFDAFKQSCVSNPGAYVAGAVRGEYSVGDIVPGLYTDQICSLYGPAKYVWVLGHPVPAPNSNKHLGDYTRRAYTPPPGPGQVNPG